MATAKPILALSPDERRSRIAELLCKAIHAGGARQGISNSVATSSAKAQIGKTLPPTDEERILNYLSHVGQATPRVLRAALGLPRTTMYRVLLRLSQQGLIGTSGNGRAVTHWLADRDPNQAAGLGAVASVRLSRLPKGPRISA